MTRILVALAVALALAAAPAAVLAQKPAKAARVAYVWLHKEGPSAPYSESFRARMAELGWKEGETLIFEGRDAQGDPARLASIMEELVRSKVDVIVAMCTPEATAARKATATIPIVVTAAGDLVKAGLVTSFAQPGGNITGFTLLTREAGYKRLEFLNQWFPKVKRATVIWNPARPENAVEVADMQAAAKSLGITLQSQQVRTQVELDTVLEMLSVDGSQAILNAGDHMIARNAQAIVRRAAQLGIPGLYTEPVFPRAGGLMSYGADSEVQQRRAAEYVDRILKGEKPGAMPIEQAMRWKFVVNRAVARAQGWRIPDTIMLRVDQVIDR
jgi:putative tryptophan/tyrosine transport system substrate-binding protein